MIELLITTGISGEYPFSSRKLLKAVECRLFTSGRHGGNSANIVIMNIYPCDTAVQDRSDHSSQLIREITQPVRRKLNLQMEYLRQWI